MNNEPIVLLTADKQVNSDRKPQASPVRLSSFTRALGFTVNSKDGVVIAIDSGECFALPSTQLNLRQFKSEESLSIALEEHLPLNAEEMVIGVTNNRQHESLAIVSEHAPLHAEVERLESEQRWIAAVSCMPLLAVQELSFEINSPQSFDCLWKSHLNGWDLVHVRNKRPVDWQWGSESDLVTMCCLADQDLPLIIQGKLADEFVDELTITRKLLPSDPNAEQIEFAIRMTNRITKGLATPWVNLAGNRLPTREPWAPIRTPLLILLGIVCMALIAFQSVLLWQSSELAESATESDNEQIAAYRQLFPGQKIPTDIVGLLRSEQRRLQSSQEEMQKEPPVYSALPVLCQFLTSLPNEAKFRFDNIRAQSKEITTAVGATHTLDDFRSVQSSLRQAGFEFQQPDVVNMTDGFSLRLERLTPKPK